MYFIFFITNNYLKYNILVCPEIYYFCNIHINTIFLFSFLLGGNTWNNVKLNLIKKPNQKLKVKMKKILD